MKVIDTKCERCGYRVLVWIRMKDEFEETIGRCRKCGGKREILGMSNEVKEEVEGQ